MMYAAALLAASVAAAVAADPAPGIPFRDCPDCPELVIVPPGRVTLGSTDAETAAEKVPADYAARERPLTTLTLKYPVAIGRYEVTVGEFAAFVAATGAEPEKGCAVWHYPAGRYADDPERSWRDPGFPQTVRDPVLCVNTDDALRYADWMSRKGWFRYRLPSEAEWEYAARAGTTAPRPWAGDARDLGRAQACEYANVYDIAAARKLGGEKTADNHFMCADRFVYTAPVGSFPANAFGLHDVLGNVSEWVADCSNPTWQGLSPQGTARMTGNCTQHMTRGGSWIGKPWTVRSAERGRALAEGRNSPLGFRIARDGAP
jgi:formylglycine-generating enzyme required for sulfatase activity